jgi:hypothetical protein
MRRHILILLTLAILAGCEQSSNIVAPLPSAPLSVSNLKDSILYTFSVPKAALGIFDTLTMSLTAVNRAATPETLSVSDYFYTWSLTDDNGKMIASGPTVLSNLILRVPLNPHQSAVLYRIAYTMADIFGAPIAAGSYRLTWNLRSGLSFQLTLSCGKSENEITDPAGLISPIYPLKVGNKWTFRESYGFDGAGIGADTVTQSIVGEEMMNGEKWFLLKSTAVDQLVTARQDGIYVYYPDINTAVLRYKYPATIGEQYASWYEEWTGAALTLVTFQMSVDSTNEDVIVPSGQYQCYKYHAPEVIATFGNETNEVGSEDMFLSNVGPVKKVNGNVYSELLSTDFR